MRNGIALAVVSGIGIAGASAFAASPGASTLEAFAAQTVAVSPAGREDGVSRDSEREPLTVEQLAEQHAAAVESAASDVTESQESAALQTRSGQLESAATKVEAEAERLRNLATFLWPTEGGVSSGYGMRLHPILHYYRLHDGADIGGTCGQPIYAAQSGTVIKAATGGYNGGSGNNVRIEHGDINGIDVQTGYLHMQQVEVSVGQEVNKGDRIGTVGNTGLSTACHLHLSLYKNGTGSDPLEYVKK